MKKHSPSIKSIILIVALFSFAEIVSGQFVYLNPLPGSKYHNPQTTLAIKNGELIDESSVRGTDWISIQGSKSGEHLWTARLSDDRKTIVVKPERDFAYSETVLVTINSKLRKETGQIIKGTSFSFQIRGEFTPEQVEINRKIDRDLYWNESGFDSALSSGLRDLDSLPTYVIITNNNAAPGQIFYNNQDDFNSDNTNCFSTIIQNDGTVVWAQDNGINGHDFKINYNGYLTYFNYSTMYWMIMDSNYHVIDSVTAGNGYDGVTNPHDVSMYPDGHTFLLIANHETMDMTAYGGQPEATVTGAIIQELDKNKDVVWEWSGWDHFQITDASSHINLTNSIIDYVHANAISRDTDGNLLLSSRHLSELTKIDHNTGNFIWRMGGENNQFTFVNDNIPQHFSYQHDVRRIANGNITIYNNGNYLQPQISSAKEYQLDEVNKVATLVWYYEHPDVNGFHVYGSATGSAQRLPNGNTLIDWGSTSTHPDRPTLTEVDYNKNITWEMRFDQFGQKTYRAHKYVWNPCAPVNVANIKVKKITSTTAKVIWDPVKDASTYDLRYRKIGNINWKLKNTPNTTKMLKGLTPQKSYEYQLRTYCANGYVSDWTTIKTFTTLPAKFPESENDVTPIFEVYPNPANDILIMSLALDQDQQILVSIYDLAGRLLLTHHQTLSAGGQEFKLDISELPAGYYLARVSIGTLNQTTRFVKQ